MTTPILCAATGRSASLRKLMWRSISGGMGCRHLSRRRGICATIFWRAQPGKPGRRWLRWGIRRTTWRRRRCCTLRGAAGCMGCGGCRKRGRGLTRKPTLTWKSEPARKPAPRQRSGPAQAHWRTRTAAAYRFGGLCSLCAGRTRLLTAARWGWIFGMTARTICGNSRATGCGWI